MLNAFVHKHYYCTVQRNYSQYSRKKTQQRQLNEEFQQDWLLNQITESIQVKN